jgi:SAM-dependent methyltransferase
MIDPDSPARHAPAALRNRDLILEVLKPAVPPDGTVLEIASGTGEHVVHFAAALPALEWQPSDPDPSARASIKAWSAAQNLTNIRDPLVLDVRERPWPIRGAAAIICINMVHISPWTATEALMAESGRLLSPGGLLYLYGPYLQAHIPTAPSNIAFDADLRHRNPQWGLRDLDAVKAIAAAAELTLADTISMPANNLSLLFRRT